VPFVTSTAPLDLADGRRPSCEQWLFLRTSIFAF
jgi:hypothetical protein